MDNLRLVLFITGILIFAGIYLWEIRKPPPDTRKRIMDAPDSQSDKPAGDAAAGVMADPDRDMSDPGRPAGDEAVATGVEQVSGPKNSGVDPEQELITLFITATEDAVFKGADVRRAARDVGMMYGPMKIFHYYGSERMQSDQPLFSMANMFEPGGFDLETMSEFETTGLAVFIYLSALVDGPEVFDLFISSVREIATALGGNIRMINRELLDDADVEAMRERIK